MLIKSRRDWELPESAATPESVFLSRRALLGGAAAVATAGLAGISPAAAQADDPSAGLYPAPRNPAIDPGRSVTPERIATTYNNFYEFGTSKDIVRAAQSLPIRPWQVKIDGLVEREMTLDIDDLLKRVQLEERVYRFRCVEAWSMTVPWTGFTMKQLVDIAKPTSAARYIRFETFKNVAWAPGQRSVWFNWPYVEGVTMAEAQNDLAIFGTGAYGKPLPRQMGAPLRIILPWKYGFKSIKSIVRISFTAERPTTFWEASGPGEYGFWANVNPAVSHPRWSQASERLLDDGSRIPTQIYNGYGAQVASLYAGMPANEKLFM